MNKFWNMAYIHGFTNPPVPVSVRGFPTKTKAREYATKHRIYKTTEPMPLLKESDYTKSGKHKMVYRIMGRNL